MSIFLQEFYKIFKNKTCILVLIIALLLNIGLLLATSPNKYYSSDTYQKSYDKINSLSDDKKGEYIDEYYQAIISNNIDKYEYTNSFMGEMELFDDYRTQWNTLTSYPELLASIKQSAQEFQAAIFKNQSDFQKRNTDKTINDYQSINDVKLTFANVKAFVNIIDFAPTDLFALTFIFFIISTLLIYEKEHKLFFLLKSTKEGRTGLISAKTSVILFTTILTTFLFWGSNIFISYLKYGSVPLSVSIQSITSFTTSTLAISSGQYLLIFFLSKICIYSLLAMIFLFITLMSKKTVEIYFLATLIFGISFTLYLTIPDNSFFSILKHINIIPYILVNPIYQNYLNLDIIGYPVNTINIAWFTVIILLSLFIFLNIYLFSKNKTADTLKSFHLNRKKSFKINVNIFYHECYKLFIIQKGLIILVIFSAAASWFTINLNYDLSTDEYYYQNYMKILEGPYDQEKQKIIEKETLRFEELHQQSLQAENDFQSGKISENEKNAITNYISSQLISEHAFQKVLKRIDYAVKHPDYPIIYETGYLELFGKSYVGYKTDFTLSLLLILTIIILFTPFIANEYSSGMIQLINVHKNDKKEVFKQKGKICIIITALCIFIAYMPQFLILFKQYGLSNLFASNQSIPELAKISFSMPLICQIILLYILRLSMAYITAALTFIISQILKNTYPALLLLCTTLVLPLGIGIIDVLFINYISLNSLFSGNLIINEFSLFHIIILTIFIIIFIVLWKAKKRNLLK